MKLTMQVNSLLQVPQPPLPSSSPAFLCFSSSLARHGELQRWDVCACAQVAMHGGFREGIQGQKPQY